MIKRYTLPARRITSRTSSRSTTHFRSVSSAFRFLSDEKANDSQDENGGNKVDPDLVDQEEEPGMVRVSRKFGDDNCRERFAKGSETGAKANRETGNDGYLDLCFFCEREGIDDLHKDDRCKNRGYNTGDKAENDDQQRYYHFEGKRFYKTVDRPFQLVVEKVDEKAHDKDDLHDPDRDSCNRGNIQGAGEGFDDNCSVPAGVSLRRARQILK